MNSFSGLPPKTSTSASSLPKPAIGTPNNQGCNPVIRRLEFEEDSNSNSPITATPTKSFANLFLKKERKHYSDPVQLKSKTFPNPNPFDSSLGLTSLKSPKKELVDILQENESKTTLGESLNENPGAETFQDSYNTLESKNDTSLLDSIEPKFDVYQRKKSNSQGSFYHFAEKMKVFQETQPKLCSEILDKSIDLTRNLSLSTSKSTRDPDLKTISPQKLASYLYDIEKQNYIIVDCRYRYEYNAGHIRGALHIETPELLEQIFVTYKHLLSNPQYLVDLKTDMNLTLSRVDSYPAQTVEQQNSPVPIEKQPLEIIFHCEFSQKRGPRVFRALRKRDRELNAKNYPHLDFPEIFVLEGGYSTFYPQFPEYCEGDYLKMKDKRFTKEYAEAKDASKRAWKKSLNAVDDVEDAE